MLKPGLYEQLVNELLQRDLKSKKDFDKELEPVKLIESSNILSRYVSEILEKVLLSIRDEKAGITKQVDLINKIMEVIDHEVPESQADLLSLTSPPEKLLSLLHSTGVTRHTTIGMFGERPATSISQTSLFTASGNEPEMVDELKKEILTSDKIDILVSFIKWSGIRLLFEELKTFTQNGGKLRVITTSYLGATDSKAIEELSKLDNTEIKISYDTKRTRLHAKAYIFQRETMFSTAYIGSSNLSNIAISSGLEWNVKVAAKDLPSTMSKINATFDSYWNSKEFDDFTFEDKDRLVQALKHETNRDKPNGFSLPFDIRPYPYQQEILDKLEMERQNLDKWKNLLVAATGTGKTVISAFDYKKFCELNVGKANKLLFVAHREEILRQSRETFRGILKDNNFGDLHVGQHKADSWDHLFISIQSFNSQKVLEKTGPDYYDYIIIDEFHHAEAKSYRNLISGYRPKILLGLTATPERNDGVDVAKFFEGRISAEIRLPEAIDRKLLSPFQYFGVTDSVDISEVAWKRGSYDETKLTELYATNKAIAKKRASQILNSLDKYVTDISSVKGIGFCVSVRHAQFMSDFFNDNGIDSISLTSETPDPERTSAIKRLERGELKFIFVVDIYNEGVDIPEVNTILFLRPTQSLTVFLQQLGRGLRLSEGKECLTVLDFIGRANTKYNFEEKFAALVSKTNRSIQKQVKDGFVHLPRGSYIQLERVAKEHILENIKKSFSVKSSLVIRIKNFEEDTGKELTFENFLSHYHLDPIDVYSKDSFSRLCVQAKLREDFTYSDEKLMPKGLQRISAIDSRDWIRFLTKTLKELESTDISLFSDTERRMLSMFGYTIWLDDSSNNDLTDLYNRLLKLKNCKPLYNEILELLDYNLTKINFVDEKVKLGFDSPLYLYCNYSKEQILTAFNFHKPNSVREGVKHLPSKNVDLFFITLNKTESDYSPTTMYEDYSIDETLFHWQSQSTTSETSNTGQRYINHKERNSKILLFVREYKKPIAGNSSVTALPYTFLGLADYVRHSGSKPMNIIWRLERPIPAKFLKKTNRLLLV